MGEHLLHIEHVSKKFCKNLKWSMLHGTMDMARVGLGLSLNHAKLRNYEFWALDDVNLTLDKGQILCILGSNGSGKTTLMRLISGIYPVDKGRITINGSLSSMFALKSGMHPHFTGRENIFIKGSMYGMSHSEIQRKMDWIIDFSELADFIDSPFGSYSSGMRARLGYAVAVATEPDLLIIDEGLAVGDAAFRTKCFKNLKSISHKTGIIFITHNIKRVTRIATDVIVLDRGKIIRETNDVEAGLEFFIRDILKMEDTQYIS